MNRTIVFFIAFLFALPLFAATLKPESVEQFFVAPNTESVIRFQIVGDDKIDSAEFQLVDSNTRIPVKIDGKIISATVSLPQGFAELEFGSQRFGIVALPAFEEKPDKFFAIDAALSWLVGDEKLRAGLVKAAKRSGIGMIRERLSWGDIEPKDGQFDWETYRHYDTVRKLCKENGIEVLELFHNAPNWMEKVEKYPGDLVKTAKSWDAAAAQWNSTWGGFEIWNEPEISFGAELPADQYVPMARAIAYRLKKSGVKTPLFGGVMAHFHPAWLQTAAENGLLSAVDGFSFHSYDRAPALEKLIGNYRHWLKDSGFESMPLWLTECGRPWKRGPERPPADQDWESAVDITMKGVESRCCGVERYFPFVYPYYDENASNFGMMDKQGTPCRSMAAYTQLIRVLSGADYLGDLKIDDPAILRSRAFKSKSGETVAVLYTGALKEPQKIKLPGKIQRIESVIGSPITAEGNELSLSATNLYYVWFDQKSVANSLNTKTEAMELYRASQKPRKAGEKIPAVAIRFQYDKEKFSATPDGYFISKNAENSVSGNTVPLTFRVFNFGEAEKKYHLRFEIGKTAALSAVLQKEVTVAGQSSADLVWDFPFDKANLSTGEFQTVRVIADGENLQLVLKIRGEATWDGAASAVKNVQKLPVNELDRWRKNAPAICELNLETPQPSAADEAVWRMTATFTGEGDRWVYPRFKLPDDIELTKASGILIEARCIGNATPRFFLFEKSGAGYLVDTGVPADGQWHVAKLPFTKFQHNGATHSDENNRLDLDQVDYISFGANSRDPKCTLEIKRISVYSH